MESEVIDMEDVEIGELVPVQRGTGLAVMPEVTAKDLVGRLDVIKDAMRNAMERDVDYGVIPGTGNKPTLLKPGSEKLGVLFQLDIEIDSEKIFNDDHLTVLSKATVYHAPTGTRLGTGEGLCSTYESKYRWRNESRKCPQCGKEAIIKGKEEYGGGWLCYKKKDGCGAKFSDNAPEIETQVVGKIANPDIPDTWNTVLKMAEKRARIDAVLAVTGASALFTQDVGDTDVEPDRKPEVVVEIDGKKPEKMARSWSEWAHRMEELEVPQPVEWANSATETIGGKTKAGNILQRANTTLLWFADNTPESSLGFWSVPEIQEGFARGWDGALVEPPKAPEPKKEEE